METLIAAVGEAVDPTVLPPGLLALEGPAAPAGGSTAPGVFVGGDLIARAGTVAAALREGARAAARIHAYLEGGDAWEAVVPPPVAFEDLHLDTIAAVPRAPASRLEAAARLRGFDEVERGLGARRAAREAARCLHCGACSACDLCWALCPDTAILREAVGPAAAAGARPTRYLVDLEHCKGCGICAAECPRAAIVLEAVR